MNRNRRINAKKDRARSTAVAGQMMEKQSSRPDLCYQERVDRRIYATRLLLRSRFGFARETKQVVNVGVHQLEEREKKKLSISTSVRETDEVRGVLIF